MSDHNSENSNFDRAKPKKCSFKKFNLLANLKESQVSRQGWVKNLTSLEQFTQQKFKRLFTNGWVYSKHIHWIYAFIIKSGVQAVCNV